MSETLFPRASQLYAVYSTIEISPGSFVCIDAALFRKEHGYLLCGFKVSHIKREKQHRVFKGLAAKSKSSIGWFYGFKRHLVINDRGEIMAVRLTAANVDDRQPVLQLTQHLTGKLFGDKGYIASSLTETLNCYYAVEALLSRSMIH